VCLFPSHSWTPCQHRVGQSHHGCGFAMPLFSSFHCFPSQHAFTLLQLWHLQRAFPIMRPHSTDGMHGIVASRTSSGDSNLFPLTLHPQGFALARDVDIILPQRLWLARTLLLLQLLETWWGRMFNARLEHSAAPWIKHSQLAIHPDCLQCRAAGAWPSAMEATSSGWTVSIVSVDHCASSSSSSLPSPETLSLSLP